MRFGLPYLTFTVPIVRPYLPVTSGAVVAVAAALGGGASGGATRLREIQLAAASPNFQKRTPTGRSAHAATLVVFSKVSSE